MLLTQELKELRERNEKRLAEAKARLGSKWLLHPQHQVQKKQSDLIK